MASLWKALKIPSSPQYTLLPLTKEESSSPIDPSERPADRRDDGGNSNFRFGRQLRLIPYLILGNIFFMLYVLTSSSTPSNDISLPYLLMEDSNATTNVFNTYIGDIETFLHDHPNSVAEESSFARMGLFTRLYARILTDHTTSEDLLDSFETALWFFAPGIKRIRQQQHFTKNATKSAKETIMLHIQKLQGKKEVPSRGIVLPVGKDNFMFANHFISSVRDVHKSEMPIEVIYRDEADLPLHQRNFLTETFTNIITTGIKTMGVFNGSIAKIEGWTTKPFALVASNFSEVMLADADAVLLAPPEVFFENEDYKKYGTLFFSDRNVPTKIDNIHKWLLKQFGANGPGPSESLAHSYFWQHSSPFRQEAGINILDKRRPHVFASLLFATWMNLKDIREKVTHTLFHGDKETFWLAFEIARLPYYINNHGAGNIGSKHHAKSKEFCGEHPMHFFEAPNGTATIVSMEENPPLQSYQRNLSSPAWMNGSLRNNKNKHDTKELIDPGKSVWSMDGNWFWGGPEVAFCQRDHTTHTMGEFGLGPLLDELVKAGKIAEKRAEDYLASV